MNGEKIKLRMSLANHVFCVVLEMYIESYPDFSMMLPEDNIYCFKQFINYINKQNLIHIMQKTCDLCEFRFKEFLKNPQSWVGIADGSRAEHRAYG